jgi:hypothetical protein
MEALTVEIQWGDFVTPVALKRLLFCSSVGHLLLLVDCARHFAVGTCGKDERSVKAYLSISMDLVEWVALDQRCNQAGVAGAVWLDFVHDARCTLDSKGTGKGITFFPRWDHLGVFVVVYQCSF